MVLREEEMESLGIFLMGRQKWSVLSQFKLDDSADASDETLCR